MKLLPFILCVLAWIAAALYAAWAFGALYFDFPKAGAFAAILFVIALLAIVIFVRGKLLKLGIVFGACALVAAWWLTLKPSNDRAWQPDVAQTAWAEKSMRLPMFTQCAWNNPFFKFSFKFFFHLDDRPI